MVFSLHWPGLKVLYPGPALRLFTMLFSYPFVSLLSDFILSLFYYLVCSYLSYILIGAWRLNVLFPGPGLWLFILNFIFPIINLWAFSCLFLFLFLLSLDWACRLHVLLPGPGLWVISYLYRLLSTLFYYLLLFFDLHWPGLDVLYPGPALGLFTITFLILSCLCFLVLFFLSLTIPFVLISLSFSYGTDLIVSCYWDRDFRLLSILFIIARIIL
jgi:hypothetical protein